MLLVFFSTVFPAMALSDNPVNTLNSPKNHLAKGQSFQKTAGPTKQGLYDPQHEHDACGVGFVVQMKGKTSHDIVQQGLTILINLDIGER